MTSRVSTAKEKRSAKAEAKQDAKAARLLAKKASREQVSRENRNQGVADPSQVAARRREVRSLLVKQVEAKVQATPAVIAANDSQVTGRNRPVLTLKRG